MTEPVKYLELEDLLIAAEAFLSHPPNVRDYGLVESALARPKATVFGPDAYPTIHEKAAALLDSVVNYRALVDGNKRLGRVALRLFYGFNGYTISASEDEKVILVLDVARRRAERGEQNRSPVIGAIHSALTPERPRVASLAAGTAQYQMHNTRPHANTARACGISP